MHPTTQEVLEALFGYAVVFAAAVAGLSAWIGKVVATRISRQEAARIDREAREHADALVRRRDVYSRLATGMRVFHESAAPASPADRQEFLKAYDQSCVWVSEAVAEKVGAFLDIMALSDATMDQKKAAYAACVLEMRRDSGFPSSSFKFRFVRF